jgi:shikimate kinase
MRFGTILGLIIGVGVAISVGPAQAAIAVGAVAPAASGAGPAYGMQQVDYWHHHRHWHHRRWSPRDHHWIYW